MNTSPPRLSRALASGRFVSLGKRGGVLAIAAVALLTVAVATVFVVAAAPAGFIGPIVVSAALLVLMACVALPVQTLPAFAVVLFAVLPMQLLPSEGLFNVVRPATVVLAVWVIRRALASSKGARTDVVHGAVRRFEGRLALYVVTALFLVWLAYSTWRSESSDTSTAWVSSLAAGAFLPLLVFDARREAAALKSALLWSGAGLGAYAVIEQVLGASPVYDTLSRLAGVSTVSPWAVYRSEASFGHPLFAGAFLAVPAALGIGAWLAGGTTRQLVLGAISAVGVVMTVSRSSILAVAIGCVAAIVGALVSRRSGAQGRRIAAVIALAAVAGIATAGFGPLEQRSSSEESSLSAGVRTEAVTVAVQAAQVGGWLGTGPATSGDTGRLFSSIVIENSLLQLLISVGIPGLALFALLFVIACLEALRRGDAGSFAAIAAYLAAITGFNSIDAVRGMHVMLGFLLLLALNGGSDEVDDRVGRYRPPTSRRTSPRPPDVAVPTTPPSRAFARRPAPRTRKALAR